MGEAVTEPQPPDKPGLETAARRSSTSSAGGIVPSVSGGTFGVADPVSNQVYAQAAAGDADDVEKAVRGGDRRRSPAGRGRGWRRGPGRRYSTGSPTGSRRAATRIAAMETFDTGLPITQAKGQAARAAENFRYFADVIVAQHEEAFSPPGQLGYVLPQAGRGGRADHAVEHAVHARVVEARARARVGLRGRAEAGGVDAAVGVAAAGDHDRGGRARRGVQHRARHRRAGGGGAGRAPGRAADLVHRRDDDRADHHAVGRREPQGALDGARREVAVRHLRRRGSRRGARLRSVRGDVAERRAVHGGFKDFGRTTVYDTVVARLSERAARVRVGDPSDPATEIGALVHPEHYDRVMSYVRLGAREGARLVAGGGARPGSRRATTWRRPCSRT